MDYANKSKEEIIDILNERKISFNSNKSKDELIELLLKKDNSSINGNINHNALGKAGAIINMVLSGFVAASLIFIAILILFTGSPLMLEILFLSLGISVGPLLTFIFNLRYLRGKGHKVLAGVLGIFFAGLVGGILVLLGDID